MPKKAKKSKKEKKLSSSSSYDIDEYSTGGSHRSRSSHRDRHGDDERHHRSPERQRRRSPEHRRSPERRRQSPSPDSQRERQRQRSPEQQQRRSTERRHTSADSSIGTPTDAIEIDDGDGERDNEVVLYDPSQPTQHVDNDGNPVIPYTGVAPPPVKLVDRTFSQLLSTQYGKDGDGDDDDDDDDGVPARQETKSSPPFQVAVVTESVPVIGNLNELLSVLQQNQAKQLAAIHADLMHRLPPVNVSTATTTTTTTMSSSSPMMMSTANTSTTAVSFATSTRMTTAVSRPSTHRSTTDFGSKASTSVTRQRSSDCQVEKDDPHKPRSKKPTAPSSSTDSYPRERSRPTDGQRSSNEQQPASSGQRAASGQRPASGQRTTVDDDDDRPTSDHRPSSDQHHGSSVQRPASKTSDPTDARHKDYNNPSVRDKPPPSYTSLEDRSATPPVSEARQPPDKLFVADPRFDNRADVDEKKIIRFFYDNTYTVDDVMDFYQCKEENIPFLSDLQEGIRPKIVRVDEAILDLTDCTEQLWLPTLQRFKAFVQGGFMCESDGSEASSPATHEKSTRRRSPSPGSDAESVDSQFEDDLTEAPEKSDATMLKDAIRVMQHWDDNLRVVGAADAEAKRTKPKDGHPHKKSRDSESPEPPPEPGAKACLPPHPRVRGWYDFTTEVIDRDNKNTKPGSAIHLEVSKKAGKLFSTGARAKHLSHERLFPLRFDKISSIGDQAKVLKIRTQPLSLSAPVTRVTEALVRAGVSTQSYGLQFITAILGRLDNVVDRVNSIKSYTRDKHAHPRSILKRVEDATSGLIKTVRDIKKVLDASYMAADANLAAWISLDYNITLAQRDRLISRLMGHMKFAAVNLRRSDLQSAELFPNIEEVLLSSEKELSNKSQMAVWDFVAAQSKKDKTRQHSAPKQKSFVPRNKGSTRGGRKRNAFRDNYSNNNSSNNYNNNKSSGRGGRGRGRGSNYQPPPSADKSKSK
jgi:hypothetical protein